MARSQLPDFEGDFSPKSSDPGELQTLIAIRETQLGEVVAVRSELEVRVDDLTLRYQESEQARIEAQTQLTALETRLADRVCTDDELAIDVAAGTLTNKTSGEVFELLPLGEVGPIIEAGGLFPYAKKVGMLG